MKKTKILALLLLPFLTLTCKKTAFYAMDDTTLILSANKSSLKTNGDTALITVIGITADGEAVHDHTLVTFTATLGTMPVSVEMMDGRATVEFVSGSQNGTAKITARSGNNVSDPLEITIGSGALAVLTLNAVPALLEPGGGYALISVYTFDAAMNPLADIAVILSTSAGELDHGNTVRLTDKNGLVSENLYTEKTATVTALSGSISKNVTIAVGENVLPTSNFTISPGSVKTGETVYFNGSLSMDSDGRIVNWEWNFGDGSSGRGEKTTHAYAKAGTYSVTLKVTDNDGGSDVCEKTVTITDPVI
ncbi:MAG: PKD domain-containing protein [Candidatus Aminicenantes bacterium]|nr:PKD domain-containing protein [Candidatus Aminicenantes bacterium]